MVKIRSRDNKDITVSMTSRDLKNTENSQEMLYTNSWYSILFYFIMFMVEN